MTDPEPAEGSASPQPRPARPTVSIAPILAPQDTILSANQPEPRPFTPLFTLVTNTSTGTTHHPRVRYIFSDDDPSFLTEALIQSQTGEPDRRAVLLDLAHGADGSWEVACAASLSPEWAVMDIRLSRTDEGPDATNDGEGGLILRIQGAEHEPVSLLPEPDLPASGSGAQGATKEDYASLIDEFERRMVGMRKVVAAGEERRCKMVEQELQPLGEIGGGDPEKERGSPQSEGEEDED